MAQKLSDRLKSYSYKQRRIAERPEGYNEREAWRRIQGDKSPWELEDEREAARRRRKLENIRVQKEIDREAGF